MSTPKRFLGLVASAALVFAAVPLGGGCGDRCDLEVDTTSLPNGFVGVFYDFELESDCGGDAWFLEEGNLPPGLMLQQDGDLRGTPTRAGVYDFTVSVVDFDHGFDDDDDIAFAGLSIVIEE